MEQSLQTIDNAHPNRSEWTDSWPSLLAQGFSKSFIPEKDSLKSNHIVFLINQD